MSEINLDQIITDDDCQLRAAGSKATVQEYADALAAGASFPPVVVFCDADGRYWLADGFHRVEAHRAAGREKIAAEVHQGQRRDAVLHASGANASHGLRRTQDDKRKAIMKLLNDSEWRNWSDREIARHTKTDHKTVGKLRRELSGEAGEIPTKKLSAGNNSKAGEILASKPMGLTAKILAGLSDDDLIAEVKRRGLIGGAA